MKFLGFVATVLLSNYVTAAEKHVVCYYGTWATYRYGLGKFDVENINTNLCTHIVYTFVGIDYQGTVTSLDPYLDLPDNWGRNNFGKFNALKKKNPSLKTILAVGGWNEASEKYSLMAANPKLRQNFVKSATNMVRQYGFDGLDVDWEYPNRRDTIHGAEDVDNYSQLLKELRQEFDKHGLMLSAAVASVKEMASASYDIATISQYLDIINIMTYDMYGPWDAVTGHNCPLHKGEGDDDVPTEDVYSVDVALQYWLDQGCPPEKIILGVPLYGHTFMLQNSNHNTPRAPSNGPGIAGPYTATNGVIGYNEFCQKLRTEAWDVRYDELAEVPYAVQGQNWVSYDNVDSITKKVEYGLKYNVSGIMVWSIETDDFHGICHGEDFPILRAINKALSKDKSSTVTTPLSSTSAPSSSAESTTAPPANSTPQTTTASPTVCKSVGLIGDPDDCSSFYMCIKDVAGNLVPKKFVCPNNLVWDQENLYCNYPENVECNV